MEKYSSLFLQQSRVPRDGRPIDPRWICAVCVCPAKSARAAMHLMETGISGEIPQDHIEFHMRVHRGGNCVA